MGDEKLFEKKDLVKQLMVSKRNDMIQKSRQNLTLREQKAVLYMLTKVKPSDQPGTKYLFSALEFSIAIGIQGKARYNYKVIMDMLQKLSDKSWWIRNEEESENQLVRWFNTVHVKDDKIGPGKIEITFHEEMTPYIYGLIEQQKNSPNGKDKIRFSTYGFSYTIPMKNKYSPRLWEILKTYEYNNEAWYFDLDDLMALLAPTDNEGNPKIPTSWYPFSKFKIKVLEPAVEEINKYTDIIIKYAESTRDHYGRKSRSVQTITFFMEKKTEKEIEATDDLIMNEIYTEEERTVIKQENDNYNSIKQEFEEERKLAKELEDYEKLDKRIEESEYPILTSEYPEFDDKQIKALYVASTRFIPKEIDITFHELWVSNYIQIYYNEILATNNNTKTNTFNRLYACLLKDYRNIAASVEIL